ncbi:hypothetical protein LX36DRAFT_661002 [Colletotrichum falcatum]|nr:hypothetical protein LX36DRAFT_661002 [Colletotrichum falcatum]
MKPTHFLCIPLVTQISRPQLSKSLGDFKAYISSPRTYGIPQSAVRPLGTIHITLGVMHLPGTEDVDRAAEVLRSTKSLFPAEKMKVSLKGAGVFPGADQSHVDIVFAHPTCRNHDFNGLCHKIRDVFEEANLIDKSGFGLSLHATIINARKTPRGGVDARKLLQNYRDYTWMHDVPIEQIGICRMGAVKQNGDEYYPLVYAMDV